MTNFRDLDTPTLLVDLDRLENNLCRMATLVREGGKTLRPHTKTHKTPEIAQLQIQHGAVGLTVAKLGEAETLADAGFDDIFIANQLVGAIKVERLLSLLKRAKIQVGVDSREVAEPIGEAAKAAGLRVPMLIEVDTGLGRAGVRSLEEGLELAAYIDAHSGLSLLGVFAHEGHLYTEAGRAEASAESMERMRLTASEFGRAGLPCEVVSVGSTPGSPYAAKESGITEMRPGVYVFNDRTQVSCGVSTLEQCALTVLATVISVRSDGRILVDAGTKTLAGDLLKKDGTCGQLLEYPHIAFVNFNEEHGYLQASGTIVPKVGEKVRIVPNHACTCVNLHETLTAFRGETVEAIWRIAGRGKIR